MPKARTLIRVQLPPYDSDRNRWRREIQRRALEALERRQVEYAKGIRVELRVLVRLSKEAVLIHDCDNLLKDIMDALQGRKGGPKKVRPKYPIIPNDRQVWRVVIQKAPPKGKRNSGGWFELRRFGRALSG